MIFLILFELQVMYSRTILHLLKKSGHHSAMCLEPCQTYKIELFTEIVDGFNYFHKQKAQS